MKNSLVFEMAEESVSLKGRSTVTQGEVVFLLHLVVVITD